MRLNDFVQSPLITFLKQHPRLATFLLTSMLMLMLFLFIEWLDFPGCKVHRYRLVFKSPQWKGDIVNRETMIGHYRHRMLDDLTKNRLKATMTKDDIEKLLGPPDEVVAKDNEGHKKHVCPQHNSTVDEYWLYEIWGACTFCAHFYIGFDDNGFYCHHYVRGQ